MKKILDGKGLILFLVVIVASFVRVIFDANEYINNIIATINVVSILYVYYAIVDLAEEHFKLKIKKVEYIGVVIQNKKIGLFKRCINIIWLVLIVVGALYIMFLANAIINDIISLFALFLSIETNLLSDEISDYFCNMR